ncbi:MAG TPA: sulfotransferase, partial [Vicinamibacteria bacterium]
LLRGSRTREVAGDAVEGFNPAHDVCRLLLNAAVAILRAGGGGARPVPRNLDFTLEALPAACPEHLRADATWLHLDEVALGRKLDAARGYRGMEEEVRAAFARHGTSAFAVESLRVVRYGLDIASLVGPVPFYEVHGQRRVEQGVYEDVIRFQEHMQPLAQALERHVAARTASAGAPALRPAPPPAAPVLHVRPAAPPPFPVVCGVARSGTTLLRLMLDAHAELAIPPETGFLRDVSGAHVAGRPLDRDGVFASIAGFETWPDFGLSRESLRRVIDDLDPFTSGGAVRAFYRLYAARFGKPRAGDKTPMYAQYLPEIQELLPEAHFIHIVRDGRDVALSLREVWFSPGDDMETLARHWTDAVTRTRSLAPQCRHYLEVRYEDLVQRPPAVLREICAFLALPYDPAMTDYHLRAPARLAEVRDRRQADGTLQVSRERRLWQQRRTTVPPDVSRVGRWRLAMTAAEREAFESVAGDLLAREGYESGRSRARSDA